MASWFVGLPLVVFFAVAACSKENSINITNNGAGNGGAAGSGGAAGGAGSPQAGAAGGPACTVGAPGDPVVAVQVAVGLFSSCARMSDGTAQCWGSNAQGQLGNGKTAASPTPVQVAEADGKKLSGLVDLRMGATTTCAVDCTGTALCWGNGVNGTMGNGNVEPNNLRPVRVPDLADVKRIAVGLQGVCALHGKDGESVSCWGSNFAGFIGNGKDASGTDCGNSAKNCVLKPSKVVGTQAGMTDVTVGDAFACAWGPGSNVSCWGSNAFGQLGVSAEDEVPFKAGPISTGPDFVEVAAGASHACGLRTGLGVSCWGNNTFGQLSTPPSNGGYRYQENRVDGGFKAIAAGKHHSCAVKDGDGTALCWGENADGQLGDGTVGGPDDCFGLRCKSSPVGVTDLDGITHMAAGETHTCAVAKGQVYCWGNNASGQLGVSTSATPVACTSGEKICLSSPVKVQLLP